MCQVAPPIVTLIAVYALSSVGQTSKFYSTTPQQYTRNITLKQGMLRGMVVHPRINRRLPLVEVYRGIPYAAPPVENMRFMPTGSAPSWRGVRDAFSFGPVCPQKFPEERSMSTERKNYFKRLKQYLMYQSEDCLNLNIYAPYQDDNRPSMKYPIVVFIHGESFEWNSGNPYDGSVLAAYGNVIVVTLNFRLGILGFLRADRGEAGSLSANFGLVDVVAALDWLRENAGAFGGDAGAVTLAGHGTGAAATALLMISPLVERRGGEDRLFHRAILMSGTSLADWALAETSREVAYQVARALNCQLHDDFADCLRKKPLQELLQSDAYAPPHKTRFGPVVDGVLVPSDPRKSMTTFTDMFRKFELLYGVTEQEGQHLFDDVTLQVGLLEKDRERELTKYIRARCEKKVTVCLEQSLMQYNYTNQTDRRDYDPSSSDQAIINRDEVMDILSDGRTVAPVLQTGIYHSDLNIQSYFYVFSHKTFSKEHIRNKSYNGEELPYLFGVPLDGPKFHFVDSYTDHERLLSEVIMTYFCNFAYTGNPNMPRKNEYLTLNPLNWLSYDVEWPEFNKFDQGFIKLDTPPSVEQFYRKKQMQYWNEDFPNIVENLSNLQPQPAFAPNRRPGDNPLPWVLYDKTPRPITISKPVIFMRPSKEDDYGTIKLTGNNDDRTEIVYGTVVTAPSQESKGSAHTMNILMIVGGVFLLVNLLLFLALYIRCMKKKISLNKDEVPEELEAGKAFPYENGTLPNGCGFVKMLSKSTRSDDIYDPVAESSPKRKLSRQMSNSTIDAHTKVRDWITSGIIEKYSPRYFRRNRTTTRSRLQICGFPSESTLGRSPTRPVSPIDDVILQNKLMKTASIDRRKGRTQVEKISVAIDATPSGRGSSVLRQEPIEITKSLDRSSLSNTPTPLRRSVTLEDFSPRKIDQCLRKSTTSINLIYNPEPTVIKIQHGYSKSEPVQDLNYAAMRKLKTFDPNIDVNVTSRDENEQTTPLTAEEALMTIKRRNFPKVLPDYPSKEALMHKRRSMPAHNLFQPIPEGNSLSQSNSPTNQSLNRFPPAPPPRTTTLSKQMSSPQPVCVSEPTLAEEPPHSPEPEVTCNLLYVGPLVRKDKLKDSTGSLKASKDELDTSPIYDTLKHAKEEPKVRSLPRTIVSADPNTPIKRVDPKVVVKPTIARTKAEDKPPKKIPRVVVPDNQPHVFRTEKSKFVEAKDGKSTVQKEKPVIDKPKPKKSQIPTLIKTSNTSLNKQDSDSSPSSSSPSSEDSDTGTVVKRIK